jgi:hypothetical protein
MSVWGFMQELAKVIEWSTQEGVAEAIRANYLKTEPDFETPMGLWQSFQETFPKINWVGDYDLAIYVFSKTYEASVKACYESIKGHEQFIESNEVSQ